MEGNILFNQMYYRKSNIDKGAVIKVLKAHGHRMTKQRSMLLDVILENNCTSCKEIYYRVSKQNSKIGLATVYRFVVVLEGIGVINRESIYRLSDGTDCDVLGIVEFEDGSRSKLNRDVCSRVVMEGLKVCGYDKKIKRVIIGEFAIG